MAIVTWFGGLLSGQGWLPAVQHGTTALPAVQAGATALPAVQRELAPAEPAFQDQATAWQDSAAARDVLL